MGIRFRVATFFHLSGLVKPHGLVKDRGQQLKLLGGHLYLLVCLQEMSGVDELWVVGCLWQKVGVVEGTDRGWVEGVVMVSGPG